MKGSKIITLFERVRVGDCRPFPLPNCTSIPKMLKYTTYKTKGELSC